MNNLANFLEQTQAGITLVNVMEVMNYPVVKLRNRLYVPVKTHE